MGLNTTVVILNDALGEIQNDPDFGKKLFAVINGASLPQRLSSMATVIRTDHADYFQIIAIGGNTGYSLGTTSLVNPNGMTEAEWKYEVVRQLAHDLGYDLVK